MDQDRIAQIIHSIAMAYGGTPPGGGGQPGLGMGQQQPMQQPWIPPAVGSQFPQMGGMPQSPTGYQYLGEAPNYAAGQQMMRGAAPGQGTVFTLPKGAQAPQGGGQPMPMPPQAPPQPQQPPPMMVPPQVDPLQSIFQRKGLQGPQIKAAMDMYYQIMSQSAPIAPGGGSSGGGGASGGF